MSAEDLPAVTTNLYCKHVLLSPVSLRTYLTRCAVFQTVGGAFTVFSSQAAFINLALERLRTSEPDVDAARLITTGASELRRVLTPEELPGVLVAYMHGLKAVFAVSVAFCGIAFLTTLVIPWGQLQTHAKNAEKDDVPTADFA